MFDFDPCSFGAGKLSGAPDTLTRIGARIFNAICCVKQGGVIKLEKDAHPSASAHWDRHIVTWTKQTWIKHQCT